MGIDATGWGVLNLRHGGSAKHHFSFAGLARAYKEARAKFWPSQNLYHPKLRSSERNHDTEREIILVHGAQVEGAEQLLQDQVVRVPRQQRGEEQQARAVRQDGRLLRLQPLPHGVQQPDEGQGLLPQEEQEGELDIIVTYY